MAWFLCPYRRVAGEAMRYCAMADFTEQLRRDAGYPALVVQDNAPLLPGEAPVWSETEVLGGWAVVKVTTAASAATLTAISGGVGFTRLPLARLNDPLSSLTPVQRRAVRDRLEAMGYPLAEIVGALGTDLSAVTLRDVLVFAARRRLKARYDAASDVIVLDGAVQPCRPVGDVDRVVA